MEPSAIKFINQSYLLSNISKTRNIGMYIIFIIWPFIAFLLSLSNYYDKNSRRIVYLFLILYGATFVISSQGLDSFVYAQNLVSAAKLPFNVFWDRVSGMYKTSNSIDFIGPLITFLVSRFTVAHQVFFAIVAAIFGYFYLKSVNLLYDTYYIRGNLNVLVFIVFFIFINPIFHINGFRFNTAAWIFFLGAYHVVLYRNKKYLLLSILAAFMHFSFMSASLVLIAYYFLGNKNFLYVPLLILSFIIPQLFSAYITPLSSLFGEGISMRVQGYSNLSYMAGVRENYEDLKWFFKIPILYFYLVGVLFYSRIRLRKITQSSEMNNMFSFTILFLSFSNFLAVIPIGGRFYLVFYLLAATYIIMLMRNMNANKLSWVTWIGLFPTLLNTIVILRQGAETTNAWLFALMPLPFLGEPINLARIFF